MDLDQLQKVLNSSADQIKRASEAAEQDPVQVMDFIPPLMSQFQELKSFGTFEEIKASVARAPQKSGIQDAIRAFLENTKEAQEKAGPMAALFSNPQFKELQDNLEQVKSSLEKGKRVEPLEEGPGV